MIFGFLGGCVEGLASVKAWQQDWCCLHGWVAKQRRLAVCISLIYTFSILSPIWQAEAGSIVSFKVRHLNGEVTWGLSLQQSHAIANDGTIHGTRTCHGSERTSTCFWSLEIDWRLIGIRVCFSFCNRAIHFTASFLLFHLSPPRIQERHGFGTQVADSAAGGYFVQVNQNSSGAGFQSTKLWHTYIHTYIHTYLPYLTLPYLTLRYITLHYITYIHTYSNVFLKMLTSLQDIRIWWKSPCFLVNNSLTSDKLLILDNWIYCEDLDVQNWYTQNPLL